LVTHERIGGFELSRWFLSIRIKPVYSHFRSTYYFHLQRRSGRVDEVLDLQTAFARTRHQFLLFLLGGRRERKVDKTEEAVSKEGEGS
jgi:hypothetical protein